MKFVLIPVLLGFVAYASRFVYKVLVQFFRVSKKTKIITSAGICVMLFALCMFTGGITLSIAAHMLMLFFMADIVLLIFKIPVCQKYDPSALKCFDKVFSCALVFGAIIMTVFGVYNASDIQTTKYSVLFDGKECEDTRIMFVSDIHANNSNSANISDAITKAYEAEQPDVVIIGGDLTDDSTSLQNAKDFAGVFGAISEEVPVLFVYGNHDIMGNDEINAQSLAQLLRQRGITVLCDEVYEMNGIRFVGRNEIYRRSDNFERVDIAILAPDAKQKATVVIDHQPKELERLGTIGIDMSLSGHTHNGQIFPVGYLCRLFGINEMQYGKMKYGSNTAIVSSGVGTWGMNVRTQGISEIVIIDIKSE